MSDDFSVRAGLLGAGPQPGPQGRLFDTIWRPGPLVFSSATIVCGAVSVLGSYLPWASATLEWTTGTLSRVLSDVWSLRLAGLVMIVSGLVSLRYRWRWALAVAVVAVLASAIAIGHYASWQERDPAGTFNLDSGLLLLSIAAAIRISLTTYGGFVLIRNHITGRTWGQR